MIVIEIHVFERVLFSNSLIIFRPNVIFWEALNNSFLNILTLYFQNRLTSLKRYMTMMWWKRKFFSRGVKKYVNRIFHMILKFLRLKKILFLRFKKILLDNIFKPSKKYVKKKLCADIISKAQPVLDWLKNAEEDESDDQNNEDEAVEVRHAFVNLVLLTPRGKIEVVVTVKCFHLHFHYALFIPARCMPHVYGKSIKSEPYPAFLP